MTVRILQGDCRDVLKTLPDESVHCVVTSPPYWGLRDYGVDGQIGLENSPSAFVDALVGIFSEVRRVLRPDGTLWLNLGDSYARAGGWSNNNGLDGVATRQESDRAMSNIAADGGASQKLAQGLKSKVLVGIPWRVAFALQSDGWYLRQDIIWAKPNPMPESVTDRCTKAHEYIFLLAKSQRYYFNADAIAEESVTQDGRKPYARGQVDKRGNGHDRGGGTDRIKTNRDQDARWNTEFRNKRSVWLVGTMPYTEAHFATFPPALIEPCILAGCPDGGTVLDPFGGAGTTGLVADRHKRNAILIELNPEYAAMARRRITNDAPLFAEVT